MHEDRNIYGAISVQFLGNDKHIFNSFLHDFMIRKETVGVQTEVEDLELDIGHV